MDIKEKLKTAWEKLTTRQLAGIFEQYMENKSVRKYRSNRLDNTNTYLIDGKTTGWNRVECYYHKNRAEYGKENLVLVLRKEAGNYFIIKKRGERAFEIDYRGILHFDEALLAEITGEHKTLFDEIFKAVGV